MISDREEMARRDKARYEMEKSMYTGPWKVPANQKKPRRDPAAPKRPMSAFLSYSNSKRAKVKVDNPDISNADISRILARMWKEAPEEERKIHIEKEYALRQSYKKAIAEWRKNADQEAQAARQKREDIALKRLEDPNSHATEMRSNADIQLSIEVAEHELQRDQRRQDPPLTATSKDDPLPYQPHGLDELHHHHHQQLYSTTVNQEPGRAGSDPANSLASMTFSPVTVYGMGVADVSSSMPYTPQAFGQFGQSIGLSQMSVNDSSFDVPGMMPNGYGLPQPPMMNVFGKPAGLIFTRDLIV